MSMLWTWVNKKRISRKTKTALFLSLNSLFCCIMGFVVWMLVSKFALCTLEWAICFVGYPGFFGGYIGGFIFLCQQ